MLSLSASYWGTFSYSRFDCWLFHCVTCSGYSNECNVTKFVRCLEFHSKHDHSYPWSWICARPVSPLLSPSTFKRAWTWWWRWWWLWWLWWWERWWCWRWWCWRWWCWRWWWWWPLYSRGHGPATWSCIFKAILVSKGLYQVQKDMAITNHLLWLPTDSKSHRQEAQMASCDDLDVAVTI